jgi:polyisoprenyl-phosphate glycosyltransferase
MEGRPAVSVVIPVYNSRDSVGVLVRRLIELYSSKYSLEVVLVNDGSVDGSGSLCMELSKAYDGVVFIDLTGNFSQHNAILAGLNHAGGEYVVMMDDDLQHKPEDVEGLVAKLGEGFDVVYAAYRVKKHNSFRNFGTLMNNLMARVMIGKPTWFNITSFKVVRRQIAEEIRRYDAPFPYIDGIILRATKNIGVFEVEHQSRPFGDSTYTFRKLIGLWFNGFFNFSLIPLRICIWGGFAIAFAGFVFALTQVYARLMDSTIVLGWTSIITSVMIFSGVQLIATGVMGEYIGRMFLTQNRTPAYVVKGVYSKGRAR